MTNATPANAIASSIEPWLSVNSGDAAVRFYKAAFNAVELYRMDMPDGGLVARLCIDNAGFWLSSEPGSANIPAQTDGKPIRMIVTVADPDKLFAQALAAGAQEIFPVGEEHGWRLGRLADPFGLHWEIGRPV